MLDFFRRGIKSWVAKLLLGLLIVSFAVWGIGDIFTGGQGGKVAVVGESEVTSESYARAVMRQQRLLTQRAGQLISLSDMRAAGVDQQILSGLVRDATFEEELSQLGIAIPDADIANAIASNASFQDASGNFNQFAYESTISQQGYAPREYEILMAHLLGQQILADAVTEGIDAPPGFAGVIAAYDGERRRVAAIRLPAADAPDPSEPTDAELEAFHASNGEQFREPERRSGEYLLISPTALAEELAPTDEEVEAEYNKNPDAYAGEATRTVEQIVFTGSAEAQAAADRITAGEAGFAEIAAEQNLLLEEISLGTVREGELGQAANDAAFAATEAGVVGPIQGPFGSILLNIVAVQLGETPPLEAVADSIRLRLGQERARQAAVERLEQVDDMRAGGDPLDVISEATGLSLVRFQGLDRAGTVTEGDLPPLAFDPAFLNEVMSAAVAEERDITEMSDGSYVLVMVGRVAESRIPELSEIREAVAEAWAAEQRLAAQEARAIELMAGAGGGTDLETISITALQGISERAAFVRSEPPADFSRPLVEAIFEAEDGGTVMGRSADGEAVLIVQVRGIIPVAEDALAEQVESLNTILAGSTARDQLEYFARALEQRLGSGVNVTAVEGVFEQLGQTGY